MLQTGMVHLVAEMELLVGFGGTDKKGRMRWVGIGLRC